MPLPKFKTAFSQIGIDWGASPNLAALDLEYLVALALPGLDVEHGSFAVKVPESYSLEQIAGYLSCVNKTKDLLPEGKARLASIILRRFQEDGIGEPAAGESRYVAHFFRKHVAVRGS